MLRIVGVRELLVLVFACSLTAGNSSVITRFCFSTYEGKHETDLRNYQGKLPVLLKIGQ